MKKRAMIKVMSILSIGVVAPIAASCANNPLGGSMAQSAAAAKDYDELSGTWQLTRGVVDADPRPRASSGKPS